MTSSTLDSRSLKWINKDEELAPKKWEAQCTFKLSAQHNLDLAEATIKCKGDRILKLMRPARICAPREYKKPKNYYSRTPDITVTNTLDCVLNVLAPNQWSSCRMR